MGSAIDILQERLPPGWRAESSGSKNGQTGGRLVVVAPDGRRAELVVLRREWLDPRSVLTMQVQRAQSGEALPDLAWNLEFVWFSLIIGWSGGLHTQDDVTERMRETAQLMLAGGQALAGAALPVRRPRGSLR